MSFFKYKMSKVAADNANNADSLANHIEDLKSTTGHFIRTAGGVTSHASQTGSAKKVEDTERAANKAKEFLPKVAAAQHALNQAQLESFKILSEQEVTQPSFTKLEKPTNSNTPTARAA